MKKKTCQCQTGTGKKLDETNGPSVMACWLDASRQARNNLYCIRTLHQPSNITYFISLYITDRTETRHTESFFLFLMNRASHPFTECIKLNLFIKSAQPHLSTYIIGKCFHFLFKSRETKRERGIVKLMIEVCFFCSPT